MKTTFGSGCIVATAFVAACGGKIGGGENGETSQRLSGGDVVQLAAGSDSACAVVGDVRKTVPNQAHSLRRCTSSTIFPR